MNKTGLNSSLSTIFYCGMIIWIIAAGCTEVEGAMISTNEVSEVVSPVETTVVATPSITVNTETPPAIPTLQPSFTASPTTTHTATNTSTTTPTVTMTPTSEFPIANAQMQANCRYGPGTAYLYSHGFYEGDQAEVHGRNYSATWLWVKPYAIDRHCWVAASVVEVNGDVNSVLIATNTRLPFTTFINPPQVVQAERDGDQVTVRWKPVDVNPPEDSRGYLIEATVCQGGVLVWLAVHTDGSEFTFQDEPGCDGESGGKLYAVEKHGYTDPVDIPWP